jgi:MMPL family
VAHGIKISAGVVTAAAVIMVFVFLTFATMSMVQLKEMGVGLAVAVLLDATVVRALLLPATMKLLGQYNWYLPRWLQWLPRISPSSPPPTGQAPKQPVAVALNPRIRSAGMFDQAAGQLRSGTDDSVEEFPLPCCLKDAGHDAGGHGVAALDGGGMSPWFALGLAPTLQPWGLIAAGAATVVEAKLSGWESYLALFVFCVLASASYLSWSSTRCSSHARARRCWPDPGPGSTPTPTRRSSRAA